MNMEQRLFKKIMYPRYLVTDFSKAEKEKITDSEDVLEHLNV